jgi:hypothetical protein
MKLYMEAMVSPSSGMVLCGAVSETEENDPSITSFSSPKPASGRTGSGAGGSEIELAASHIFSKPAELRCNKRHL